MTLPILCLNVRRRNFCAKICARATRPNAVVRDPNAKEPALEPTEIVEAAAIIKLNRNDINNLRKMECEPTRVKKRVAEKLVVDVVVDGNAKAAEPEISCGCCRVQRD